VEQDFEDWLSACLDDSFRVTFKVDYNNDAVTCTFTQQDNKHRNSGLIITSRSDNFVEAFWLNCYKVFVLFDGQRLPTRDETQSWG
jgi:hypothetical protein